MDQICSELGIPRRQIRATKHGNRFAVLAHRGWMSAVLQLDTVRASRPDPANPAPPDSATTLFPEFRALATLRSDGDEWPTDEHWQTVHLSVHPKHSHSVIPLAPLGELSSAASEPPLGFAGLLQAISHSNHQHLWKAAYKKYPASRPKAGAQRSALASHNHHSPSTSGTQFLAPYETVLREALGRLYVRPIVQLTINAAAAAAPATPSTSATTATAASASASQLPLSASLVDIPHALRHTDAHPNLYAAHAILETATSFYVLHSDRIDTSLLDCIAYSPAILARSHNKPLFLVYQLLQLTHALHSRGLFVGDLQLADCALRENLWLRIAGRVEASLLQPVAVGEEEEVDSSQPSPQTTIELSGNDSGGTSDLQAASMRSKPISCSALVTPTAPHYSIADYCEMWCQAHLSNFDYLTILNNLSGRRLGSAGSHHIMPWVSDFSARNGAQWRDLKKSKYRLNKGDAQLDQMFATGVAAVAGTAGTAPHHVSDVLSEITYFVYMARRTAKAVLCKHVRPIWVPAEYPVSIQRLQQWTPDECIPEFFTDASVFKSVHEDLADLEVPAWASCPEDFVLKHREALESAHVSERLHHWIDLNFGYKLSGAAAVKAKNVCLSLVNEHKALAERGVVQLFGTAHPPRRQASAWTEKLPPRIYTLAEAQRRRLTRSTEDLATDSTTAVAACQRQAMAKLSPRVFQSPASIAVRIRSPSTSSMGGGGGGGCGTSLSSSSSTSSGKSRRESSMERSTSYHTPPVQRSQHQIQLPRDYNPVAALSAVESMEQFLCKTFHRSATVAQQPDPLRRADWFHDQATCCAADDSTGLETSFTNRLFSETFDELFGHCKDSKQLLNMHTQTAERHQSADRQTRQVRSARRRNFKQRLGEQRSRDLQVLGCLVVELFAADRLRPLGALTGRLDFAARLSACLTVLRHHPDSLPRCVRYPVTVLLQLETNDAPITRQGLPPPSAQQFLQPLLSHVLFPFPLHYAKVYTALGALAGFDEALRQLGHRTQLDCTGTVADCARVAQVEEARMLFRRRIAECKVMACTAQLEGLLEPQAFEQFGAVELVLPHIVDMLRSDETAILAAWHLFDAVAVALGPARTLEHLLQPVLRLFDAAGEARGAAGAGGMAGVAEAGADCAAESRATVGGSALTAGMVHRGRKTGKLYHHSFLLRLIVRFGLEKFLEHFVAPLIEAVGGYKEADGDVGFIGCPRHSQAQQPAAGRKGSLNGTRAAFRYDEDDGSFDLPSAEPAKLANSSAVDTEEEMFVFDDDAVGLRKSGSGNGNGSCTDDEYDANSAILKIIDQLDPTMEGGSVLDLRLNASLAEECTETTPLVECRQFGEAAAATSGNQTTLTSPTIPIPTYRRSTELNTIDCEIGSKKSIDSAEFLDRSTSTPQHQHPATAELRQRRVSGGAGASSHRHGIADTAAESLLWLAHRLGPVLTARHLTRNLLKMLTLCYVGQENLLPPPESCAHPSAAAAGDDDAAYSLATVNLATFSISDGRVCGDSNATKVLECLAAISALFGDQFVLRQYLPHIAEIVALCRRRITASLEGGLIGSLQLLKFLVPCLSDRTIMEQLPDTLLAGIVHPLIRLLGSGRFVMPSGSLARSVLARKFLDAVYVLAVRIGPEMTKDHLCVPALQRFFLIFDKAYGVGDGLAAEEQQQQQQQQPHRPGSPSASSDDSGVRGSPVNLRGHGRLPLPANLTPTPGSPLTQRRTQAHEEIRDVFAPSLAHVAYVTFLHYLGEYVMTQHVRNLPLILSLCHAFEQPANIAASNAAATANAAAPKPSASALRSADPDAYSNSFGTTVIGNRLEVADGSPSAGEIGPLQLLDACTYKYEQINTARHLRGNWLAYWEHECGRPDKEAPFNLKQIKLQTFAGHANSVKSLLCLDNENSFMSASKDKTVKLWSLRSEGDGGRVSQCQFTYAAHRKSVHSLAFLEALRLTVSCDSGVHMWDPFVGAQVGQLDSHRLTPVSVVRAMPAPSALVLAGTAEATVRMIDARSMAYVTEWRVAASASGSGGGSVRCVAVAPSGAWIACGLSSGQLILLDARTGVVVASWRATDGELLQLLAPNDGQLVSTSLDNSVSVWSSVDGQLLFQMKNPPEPAHCILSTAPAGGQELLFGTPANRIGVYAQIARESSHSITKLRAETFKGVLTSMALLPLNRMLLVGGDSGLISLIC